MTIRPGGFPQKRSTHSVRDDAPRDSGELRGRRPVHAGRTKYRPLVEKTLHHLYFPSIVLVPSSDARSP